jgi:hypothetical protein
VLLLRQYQQLPQALLQALLQQQWQALFQQQSLPWALQLYL